MSCPNRVINDLWDRRLWRDGRKQLGESEMWVTALVEVGGETTGQGKQEIAAEVQTAPQEL